MSESAVRAGRSAATCSLAAPVAVVLVLLTDTSWVARAGLLMLLAAVLLVAELVLDAAILRRRENAARAERDNLALLLETLAERHERTPAEPRRRLALPPAQEPAGQRYESDSFARGTAPADLVEQLEMDADQVLAFRLSRSGLAVRSTRTLAEAAACPASDFAPDAALLAVAARVEGISRDAYDHAVDAGDVVVAHAIRGAIHALAPGDLALYGRALIARDDGELAAQLGQQVKRLAAEKGLAPSEALEEVAEATRAALAKGRSLDKNELHEELRKRMRAELLPWCRGCRSHHVAPMLWRYATVKAGVRLDSERRYRMARPGRAPAAREVVRRFLGFDGPAAPGDLAEWAGLAKPHAHACGRSPRRPRRGARRQE